jgi:DNA end-binding protein Ku
VPEPDEREAETGPRSFWSGTITFGLVSIPVELYPAHRSNRVSLRMVSPEGTPLERRYFCMREERELDWGEIVRGYELERGRFVVVTEEELDKLAPDRTRDIDLRRFVPAGDIDPMHFERAYFLTPGGNSTKAYRLLAATMEKTGRAGIATFVMRGKEYLIAILAENGILRAETLRFADEVRTAEDVGLPGRAKAAETAVKKVEKAIRALTRDALDESQLEDRASARLTDLARRKAEEGEDVVSAPDVEAAPAADGVLDLMAVLKRSLEGHADTEGARRGRMPAKKATAKKTTTETTTPKRTAKKKSAAKKTAAKKTAAKKTGAKKTGAKKTAAKKTGAKKAGGKKTGGKKTDAKKAAAR